MDLWYHVPHLDTFAIILKEARKFCFFISIKFKFKFLKISTGSAKKDTSDLPVECLTEYLAELKLLDAYRKCRYRIFINL